MRYDLGKISSFWNRPTECWKCGCHSELEAAHIIPKCIGGSNKAENLVILCNLCHSWAPNVNDKEYMWEWIDSPTKILSDALDKLMNLCKSVDSVEYKKFLEIFQSKEHLDWGIENTGQHGVGTPNPARIMSTYNWSLKNYPPLKEFFHIGLDK